MKFFTLTGNKSLSGKPKRRNSNLLKQTNIVIFAVKERVRSFTHRPSSDKDDDSRGQCGVGPAGDKQTRGMCRGRFQAGQGCNQVNGQD